MLSPRSFRGDHWTLSSDMLLEDKIELCGDCSATPHFIAFDDPGRSEDIVNGILR